MSLAKMIAARMVGAKKKPVGEATRSSARNVVTKATGGAPAAETGSKSARASGTQPRHLTTRALELTPFDWSAVRPAALPTPEPLPPPVTAVGWKGSCRAVCADTGRICRLPAHPSEPDRHRHERGPFFRTAVPGQSFTRAQLLEREATRRFTTETT